METYELISFREVEENGELCGFYDIETYSPDYGYCSFERIEIRAYGTPESTHYSCCDSDGNRIGVWLENHCNAVVETDSGDWPVEFVNWLIRKLLED